MAMPHRNWAERLDDELARRGVPARFRRRLLAELRDHADDLTEGEGLTMMTDDDLNVRLGEPAALAARATEEYRRARWTSRHPLLVFGLLPLPATLLVFAVTVLLLGLAGSVLGWVLVGDVDNLPRPALVAFAYAVAWGVRFVPFVVLAVLFTRLYLRSRVRRRWFAAAAVQILLLAGSMISLIEYSDEPGKSQWLIGFAWAPMPVGDGWTLPFLNAVGWMQAVQLVVPVIVGVLVFRAARREQDALAVGG
jgi:hypothetical protein